MHRPLGWGSLRPRGAGRVDVGGHLPPVVLFLRMRPARVPLRTHALVELLANFASGFTAPRTVPAALLQRALAPCGSSSALMGRHHNLLSYCG